MLDLINKILKYAVLSAAVTGFLTGCGSSGSASSAQTAPFFPEPEDEWQMVWSDEFDGEALNLRNWDIQEGDGSEFGLERWGNNEEQWYLEENLTVADGMLTISAKEATADDDVPDDFLYTSGRIRTAGKFDFQNGRIEARVQSAAGQGLWSAFWMLPTDSPYTSWAAIGEVDIMEVVNADTDAERIFQTLHYGFPWPLNQQTGIDIEDIADPAGDFHVYAVEWSNQYIRWYIDDTHYMTIPADHWYTYYYADQQTGYQAGTGAAPFDVDFHILLNLAVGGNLPGPVDSGAIPSEMVVDYVRVYECSVNPGDGTGCNVNADRTLDEPDAQSPFEDEFPLYTDAAEALEWVLAGETVQRQLAVNSFWDNDGALTFSEVPADDEARGTVIDVMTTNSGNISINAVDGEPTSLFGFGNNPNYWELHAGELKLDLYVDSASTDADSSIYIKMDSTYPAVGQMELKVADLPADAWTTISVPVNELLASHVDNESIDPLNTGAINSFFVLEPTGAAHVQIDNISLACGHPSNNGCGILPPGGAIEDNFVNVFIDEVDPIWTNGIGAWDDVFLQDYFDGMTGNHVTWSIIDTGEEGHDDVIQANFGTSGANGLIYIQSAAGVDLTTLTSGYLMFDLRLEAGSTHGVTYKVDCFFPCSTGDLELDLSETVRGEWTSYMVPVSSLISAGLDITQVNSAIVLFPTWTQQAGVSFEIDNVRYEVPDDGGPPSEPNVAGTWEVASEPAALKVGPAPNDGSWWSNTDQDVIDRACFFDDVYIFSPDGSYDYELQDETWLEGWQTGAADACGPPIFPHDGMGEYSWVWDQDASTLLLNGTGAYVGLPKAVNGSELGSPSEAPSSTLYNIEFVDPGTLTVSIEAGESVWWTYKMVKTAEPPAGPAVVGTWLVANEPASLKVGPEPGDGTWWSSTDQDLIDRACYFDDLYLIEADGTFDNVLQDETWLEGWQTGVADACGPPLFPHDGMGDYTWEWDEGAGIFTVNGTGGYIGLPKAVNGSELSDPSAAPSSIVYNLVVEEDGSLTVSVEAGEGVWWTYKLVKQ